MTNEEIFAARVARIQAGAPNTKGTIFVGQDERHHIARPEAPAKSQKREMAGNALYPLSLVGAFGLGLIAVALGRYARFQLMAGQAELEDADLEMALSIGLGIALSFVLAQMFRLTSKEHKALQGIGVFAMVCAFHNLAFWAPGPMAAAFSPAYVAQIQSEAPPNSARIRGVYLSLFDAHSAAAETLDPTLAAAPDAATDAPVPAECTAKAPAVKRITMDSEKKAGTDPDEAACASK